MMEERLGFVNQDINASETQFPSALANQVKRPLNGNEPTVQLVGNRIFEFLFKSGTNLAPYVGKIALACDDILDDKHIFQLFAGTFEDGPEKCRLSETPGTQHDKVLFAFRDEEKQLVEVLLGANRRTTR